ncbi:hypothetical protein ACHAWF_007712 [Thalassiosira exigua]
MHDTKRTHKLEAIDNESGISSKSCAHRLARTVYFLNAIVLLAGMASISYNQHRGVYRCKTLTIEFDEKIWEDALVTVEEDGFDEPWHLVYSYFNGIYEEDGLYDGYPRYVERNKNDGHKFQRTTGAEFVYCKAIKKWVFRHKHIKTALYDKENECSWLAKSQETLSYSLLSVATDEWSVWTGKIESLYLHALCNECWGLSDCNYRGRCNEENRCVCSNDDYFGDHCQFERPCNFLKSKVGYGCGELALQGDGDQFKKMYGRPFYKKENLSGIPSNSTSPENTVAFLLGRDIHPTTEFWFQDHSASLLANYTVFLLFSGSRWYMSMMLPDTIAKFRDDEFLSEYHAFWQHSYKKDNTFLISEVTFEGCPVHTEFSLGSRQVEHVDLDGSGLFYCL